MLCRNINRQSPGDTTPYHSGMETLICRFEGLKYVISSLKAPYTLSVRLSDFTVWPHTWRKNCVNCAVLTGNSAGLRTVLSSRLSHRELGSSLREYHSFLSLPVFIHHSHMHKKTHRTDKKNWQTWWQTCAVPKSNLVFSCSFFYAVKLHSLTWSIWGPLRLWYSYL